MINSRSRIIFSKSNKVCIDYNYKHSHLLQLIFLQIQYFISYILFKQSCFNQQKNLILIRKKIIELFLNNFSIEKIAFYLLSSYNVQVSIKIFKHHLTD